LKRANYTAKSALHMLLKLSREDGDEPTTYRTSAFVYEGEHNVTPSPTATTRNYAFLKVLRSPTDALIYLS